MKISARVSKGVSKLKIEGEMTIYNAVEIKTRLIDALGANRGIDLDLTKVSEFDTAGFQILLLAGREALGKGKRFKVSGASGAVTGLLDIYRFTRPLPGEEKA